MPQALYSLEVRNGAGERLGDLLNEILVISEYEPGPFRLVPSPAELAPDLKIIVAKNALKRQEHEFIFKNDVGRIGFTRLTICYQEKRLIRDIRYQSTALRDHYDSMIDELGRFAISLSRPKGKVLSHKDLDLAMLLEDYETRIEKIAEFLRQFFEHFRQIEASPLCEPEKTYILTRDGTPEQPDLRTIFWRLTHPGNPKQLGAVITPQFNNAENRLLKMLLNQVKAYLLSSNRERLAALVSVLKQAQSSERRLKAAQRIELDTPVQNAEREAFKQAQLSQLALTIAKLEAGIAAQTSYEARIAPLTQAIDTCLRTSFLKDLPRLHSASFSPSLALMREYPYRSIYTSYTHLNQALKLTQTEELLRLLGSFPIERTSKLYEYWVFIQIFLELQQMGFSEAHPGSLLETIRSHHFNLPSGLRLELIGPERLYRRPDADYTHLYLHYEKRLQPLGSSISKGSLLPDYLLEFPLAQRCFILDAKYRHYTPMSLADEKQRTPRALFEHEVEMIAQKKYHEFKRYDDDTKTWTALAGLEHWQRQVEASFIIHSSPEPGLDDYGNQKQDFRFGGISFAPDATGSRFHLGLLLRMLFQVHLKLYDICWPYLGCVHNEPVLARHTLKPGKRATWEGNFQCGACGNKWWVNHCGHCKAGFRPKMTQANDLFNYYALDESTYQADGKTRYYLKCASCNRSYQKSNS